MHIVEHVVHRFLEYRYFHVTMVSNLLAVLVHSSNDHHYGGNGEKGCIDKDAPTASGIGDMGDPEKPLFWYRLPQGHVVSNQEFAHLVQGYDE